MEKTILHIDFDSFFASVEQQENPRLRGKPIGVTATNGRTCIIASSREAKRLGIGTGSRSFEAQRICPDIVLVPADFMKYWEVSKKFLSICKDYSPFIEVFSLDELFMDVTETAHLFGGVDSLIARIKQRIRKEIGEYITVSIGISHNKLLAKLACGLEKPNGKVCITKDNLEAIYKRAKLTDVCGIGERIRLRLNQMGIYTLLDLAETPLLDLIAAFGNVEGRFLKNVGLGIDNSPLVLYITPPQVKSVGRNYCLPKNEYDQRVVLQNVYELCEEVGIKLRRLNKKAKTVGLSLRGTKTCHGNITTGFFSSDGSELFSTCKYLYDSWDWYNVFYPEEGMVRQISVWASNLQDSFCVPLRLFENQRNREQVLATVDKLNDKYGDHTIRNGFLLYADKLTTVPNGYMADTYERTKLASSSA